MDWNLAELRREAAEAHSECHCSPDCEHLRQAWKRGYAAAKREEREAQQAVQHDTEEWPPLQCRVDWARLIVLGLCAALLLIAGRYGG